MSTSVPITRVMPLRPTAITSRTRIYFNGKDFEPPDATTLLVCYAAFYSYSAGYPSLSFGEVVSAVRRHLDAIDKSNGYLPDPDNRKMAKSAATHAISRPGCMLSLERESVAE